MSDEETPPPPEDGERTTRKDLIRKLNTVSVALDLIAFVAVETGREGLGCGAKALAVGIQIAGQVVEARG